jgi:ABC-type sugar transport system substrate-binding protein
MRVAFLNPADTKDAFFGTMVAFMERAAEGLSIELEVVESNRSPTKLREQARALVARPSPPEYLLLTNEEGLAVEVLPRADARGIKTLLLNEGLMVPDRQVLGNPGERYASWLGELVPDDRAAGYLLAKSLISTARAGANGGAVTMAALGGSFTSSSLLRINGLRQAVAESEGVTLREVVAANWEIDRARDETAKLLQRHPDLRVVWSASDHMAIGAVEALTAAGKVAGAQVIVGGIDWAPFVFEQLRRGVFSASVGGHFLDGAWALVLLYDHHHRPGPPSQVKSQLALATRDNADRFERVLTRRPVIDFRKFSKVENPSLEKYNFTVDAVL